MNTEDPIFDKNGKQIKEFDLLKVFHFKGVNEQGKGRKIYYMYKWVKMVERDGILYYFAMHLNDNSGKGFYLGLGRTERKWEDIEVIQTVHNS